MPRYPKIKPLVKDKHLDNVDGFEFTENEAGTLGENEDSKNEDDKDDAEARISDSRLSTGAGRHFLKRQYTLGGGFVGLDDGEEASKTIIHSKAFQRVFNHRRCCGKSILDPRSPFVTRMKVIVVLVLLVNFVEIPIQLCFRDVTSDIHPALIVWMIVGDIFLLSEAFCKFRVGFYDDGIFVDHPVVIAKKYLKFKFWLYLICALPFSILVPMVPSLQWIRLLKLLRLPDMFMLLRSLERTSSPSATGKIRLLLGALALILAAHFASCVWNIILVIEHEGSSQGQADRWNTDINLCGDGDGFETGECTLFQNWLAGSYFALVTLASVGYGDITPKSSAEVMFCFFLVLIGGLVYAYTLSVMMDYVKPDEEANIRDKQLNRLMSYLQHSKLPKHLRRKVLAFYEFQWSHNATTIEREVLEGLPPVLREPCVLHSHRLIIEMVPFLKNLGKECVSHLVSKFRIQHYRGGEKVFSKGELGHALFIVKDGEVGIIVNEQDSYKRKLTTGSIFGEFAVVSPAPKPRTATVVAIINTYLLCLEKKDYHAVMTLFPDVEAEVVAEFAENMRLIRQSATSRERLVLENTLQGVSKFKTVASKITNALRLTGSGPDSPESHAKLEQSALEKDVPAKSAINRTPTETELYEQRMHAQMQLLLLKHAEQRDQEEKRRTQEIQQLLNSVKI